MHRHSSHHGIASILLFAFLTHHAIAAHAAIPQPNAVRTNRPVPYQEPALPADTLAPADEADGPGDPTVQRLFIMPTAHTIREGTLMVGVHEFLWGDIAFAPTDWLQLTALYAPVPNGLSLMVGAKAQVIHADGLFHGLALSADASMLDFNGSHSLVSPTPVFTATASAGSNRVEASMSLTGGYELKPVVGFSQIGIAIYNERRDIAFIAESVIGPGIDRDMAIDDYLLMAGVRGSGTHFTFEGALMASPVLIRYAGPYLPVVFPFISGTYYF
ncbi:MAG: hypothetical protein JST22_10540 [Bacteroidetes bacterium]|nr:hypothetical protein [Bacteroidota bacterium]